jgi:hypothetical protein
MCVIGGIKNHECEIYNILHNVIGPTNVYDNVVVLTSLPPIFFLKFSFEIV